MEYSPLTGLDGIVLDCYFGKINNDDGKRLKVARSKRELAGDFFFTLKHETECTFVCRSISVVLKCLTLVNKFNESNPLVSHATWTYNT